MSETTTIITLTLPSSDRLNGEGTLLIQRGTLAHLMQFTYIGVADITAAIQSAYVALASVESDPPSIPETATPSPKPVSKGAKSTPAEAMLEIPVGKKTQRIPARVLRLAHPEQQPQAIEIASKLLASKLWDGQSVIRITDAEVILKKLKPLDDKTLALFTLADFVEIGQIEPPVQPVEDIGEFSDQSYDDEISSQLFVGQCVHLAASATDTDGDVISFNVGRIVELDESEDPTRVWVESTNGDNDVWSALRFSSRWSAIFSSYIHNLKERTYLMSTSSNTPMARVFKTGATIITESPDMRGLTVEQVKQLLKTSYPEVAHATVRERIEGDMQVVEFLPQVGRKG